MIQAAIEAYSSDNFDELTRLWEASVRSSHHFLSEEDILFLRPVVRDSYLPGVDLYVIRGSEGLIAGFIGLSEEVIEMLFVDPRQQGKGFGSALTGFAVREKGCRKVDVNEQNETAYRFYVSQGFRVISRDELDPQGKPFPILHLEL